MSALNPKLTSLLSFALESQGAHFLDIGCDHGFLGKAILKGSDTAHVHFVDQVPLIVQRLKDSGNLEPFRRAGRCSFHPYSGALLKDLPEKAVFILSGMGGPVIMKMVTHLFGLAPKAQFLLCPHTDVWDVRLRLKALGLNSKKEDLVEEGSSVRELLWVSAEAEESLQVFFAKKDHALYAQYLAGIENYWKIKREHQVLPQEVEAFLFGN